MTSDKQLIQFARDAVAKSHNSDVEVGMLFVQNACRPFLGACNDRLVKVGRRVASLVLDYNTNESVLGKGLDLIVQECMILVPVSDDGNIGNAVVSASSNKIKVPTVTFGKTKLDMPIVTLGCMRFQQEWGPRIKAMNQVGSDCQDNLLSILKQAINYGMTHIETARGYGCSELQLGVALQQLFLTNYVTRDKLIIQTKVPANPDPSVFRSALDTSLQNLKLDHVDLFAFHGFNFDEQIEWVFGNNGDNCLAVVKEFVAAGKIRHVGFSTHGSTDLILRVIDLFGDDLDYVNLHYHYFGSYTASGGGHDGNGNLDAVKKLAEKNCGIFIISPFDKGGRLYAPSKQLRSRTLPEMEPMEFKSYWLWNHHHLYKDYPQLHTYTVGAARPSDLDQPAVAAYLHGIRNSDVLQNVQTVTKRLDDLKIKVLGSAWLSSWWKGLPKNTESTHLVEHNQLVWLYNSIKVFGLWEFAKNRYGSFEGNSSKWDSTLSPAENIDKKIGKGSWGFVPGLAWDPHTDYSNDLRNVPPENLNRVMEAEQFVYKYCRKLSTTAIKKHNQNGEASSPEQAVTVPDEWKDSFDMRPWPDFPDRKR